MILKFLYNKNKNKRVDFYLKLLVNSDYLFRDFYVLG